MRPRGLWPRCPNGPRGAAGRGCPQNTDHQGRPRGTLLQMGRAPHSPRPPGARRGTAVAPTLPSSRRGSGRPPGSSTPSPGAGAARAGGGRGCGGARDASAPAEAQRGGGSAPLGDTRRRDHAPRPPVRTETRACPGARGVRGVPRLERARAGTTQGGRATGRLGSRPSGSRPSLQPHCVHVARAMGRRPPEARPPGRVASPVRARACRAAGPPTAACTILAVRPGLR